MIPRAAWSMSEAELMESIRKMCDQLGLLAFHVTDSRGSWGAGFPDLVIAGPRGYLFAECKSMKGTLSPDQRRWARMLGDAGDRWRLWRPDDLLLGVIASELTSLSGLEVSQHA